MPLCLIRLCRHKLWDELKDLSHCRQGCFFICFKKKEEKDFHFKSSVKVVHVLNLLINREETSLTCFWYCTSCTPPPFNNTVQVRAGLLSKQCGPHEPHTHLSPAVNWCHRWWVKRISSTKETGKIRRLFLDQ